MSNNSKRILIFTTAYKPLVGGSEIAIEEIIRRLPDVFFDIITPKLKTGLLAFEREDNYCIYRIGFGWIGDKFFFPISGFLKALKFNRQNHYNFFHVFQASYAGGAAWLLKIFSRKTPLILTLQEGKNLDKQSRIIKFFRNLIIKKSDRIVAISNYLKLYALKIKKNAMTNIIPNGVDTEEFTKDFSYGELTFLKDQLGIKPGEKVIISVSRLVDKNGLRDLIKSVAILKEKIDDFTIKLLLIGEGKQKQELLNLAEYLNIKEKVIFAGEVKHEFLPGYLKISDIFARASLSEGMGSAFLEAMAAGVPIIGTPVGGINDFLKNNETGLFCEVNNPENLAEAINAILTDEVLKKRLIKQSRELAIEKYDWHQVAKAYEKLYADGKI